MWEFAVLWRNKMNKTDTFCQYLLTTLALLGHTVIPDVPDAEQFGFKLASGVKSETRPVSGHGLTRRLSAQISLSCSF